MDQIFTDIRDSVHKEAEQLVSRAKRVAERTLQYARADAEQLVAARRAAAEQEAALRIERATSRRASELRRAELAQQEQLVQRACAMALERLRTMPRDTACHQWLAALLAAALPQLGAPQPVVRCNALDAPLVRELIAGTGARLHDEPAPIAGGLIVQSPDGRVSLDCSAEAELARAVDDLRDVLLARLAPPPAQPANAPRR